MIEPTNEKIRVFLHMEGGLIHDACSDAPDKVELIVLDFDLEGQDPDELVEHPDTGEVASVRVYTLNKLWEDTLMWLAAYREKENQ